MAACVAYEKEVALDCVPSKENLFEDTFAEEADGAEDENGVMMLSFGDDQSKDDDAEKDIALYDGFDRVGGLHNEIISNIYAEEMDVRELNSDEMLQLTINKSSGYYDETLSVAELTDIKTKVFVASNSLSDMTCEDPYMVLENTMPQYVNEFSIIEEYCENIASLCHDKVLLVAYMNDFINIVQNSAISQTSKNMLKAAACVGGNSSVLWQITESEGHETEMEE